MMASSGGGGYDYQFVHGTPQEFLICKICLAASQDPHLSVCCGHIFCSHALILQLKQLTTLRFTKLLQLSWMNNILNSHNFDNI